MKKQVMLRPIQQFVRRELPRKLQRDLRTLRIIKEGDLECSVYYHLRRFCRRDPEWRIFARKYARKTGRYPDITVYHGLKPRVAIELKWMRKQISRKDRRSLVSSLRRLKVKKAYFFTTALRSSQYSKLRKTEFEKYRLHERLVALDLPRAEEKIWKSKRKRFRT